MVAVRAADKVGRRRPGEPHSTERSAVAEGRGRFTIGMPGDMPNGFDGCLPGRLRPTRFAVEYKVP